MNPYIGDHQLDPPEEQQVIRCWKCKRHLFASLVIAAKGTCYRCGEDIEPDDEEE